MRRWKLGDDLSPPALFFSLVPPCALMRGTSVAHNVGRPRRRLSSTIAYLSSILLFSLPVLFVLVYAAG